MEICSDGQLCCGCSACQSICPRFAIVMREDARGFYRPEVDESKCVECGLCKGVCPANDGMAAGLKHAPIRVLAYRGPDVERVKSSSGAAFWALARYALDSGGTVYGACFDAEFRVVHRRCASADQAQACRGSKYSQSFAGSSFGEAYEDLKQGRTVLYTGTPCQISGLRSFLSKKSYAGQLVTCDVICHGTPSNQLFREYIAFLEKKSGKRVVCYSHRPKDRGWGVHIEKAIMDDGSVLYDTIESNVWRTLFYSNNALNGCCYRCLYTSVDRVADFTIADFVGVNRCRKELNDNKGLSVVMINSALAEGIVTQGTFDSGMTDISLDEIVPGNPMLQRPSVAQGDVEGFWRVHGQRGFEGVARYVGAYGFLKAVKTLAKRLLGRS